MTGWRANKTARQRDYGTTRQRDNGTTRLLKNTGILRRSQSFSVVRGCAWLCVAVRGSAWQLGVRRVADVFYRKRECRGIVLKRTAHGTLLFGIGRRCALITPSSGYCLFTLNLILSVNNAQTPADRAAPIIGARRKIQICDK